MIGASIDLARALAAAGATGRTGETTSMLAAGIHAPDFTVDDHDGNPTSLADQQGRWVLLWWYPKADTPG